jgi:hypothetical protein
MLEVYRPKALHDFTRSEIRILQRLAPHMANALRLNRQVSVSQVHQHQAEEALNQLNVGVLLLTQGSRIVFANRAAERLLRRGDGIISRDGKLAASLPLDSARMACVIPRAGTRAAGLPMTEALCIHRDGDRRPLHVWAVPLLRASSGLLVPALEADVMVIVIDPELSMAPPIDALKAFYGLTDAEARLTKGWLHGERLEDYAARAGISMNTAHAFEVGFRQDGYRSSGQSSCVCCRELYAGPDRKQRENHSSGGRACSSDIVASNKRYIHWIVGSPIIADFHSLPSRPAGFIRHLNNVPLQPLGELPLLSAALGDHA